MTKTTVQLQSDMTEPVYRPRQQELLSQLEVFFFANGYRETTMAELASLLHCSKRALYELASSRKALFTLVIDRWARRVRKLGLEAEARHDDHHAKLAAYLEPGASQAVPVSQAFLTDLRDLPAARTILEMHQRQRMAHLSNIIQAGTRAGAFKNFRSPLVAGIALAAIEKINEPAFLHDLDLTFSEAFDELYQLLMSGLQIDEASPLPAH